MPRRTKRSRRQVEEVPAEPTWMDIAAITAAAPTVDGPAEPLLFTRPAALPPKLPLCEYSAVRTRIRFAKTLEDAGDEGVWQRRRIEAPLASPNNISKPFPINWHADALRFLRRSRQPSQPSSQKSMWVWHTLYLRVKQLCSEVYWSERAKEIVDINIDNLLAKLRTAVSSLAGDEKMYAMEAIEAHQRNEQCEYCVENVNRDR